MSESRVTKHVGQLFAVLLLLTPLIATSQPAYDEVWVLEEAYVRPSREIPRQVERQLKMDAARLSLRSDMDDLRRANIRISEVQSEQFYQLLRRVYLYERAIIDCYHIKTANQPSTDYIRIVYQKEVAWAKPLKSGISSTNQPLINGILERYDLIIEGIEPLNSRQDALTIRAVKPINMEALANNFYGIEGIEAVELEENPPASLVRAGTPIRSDIYASQNRNAWDLEYILRFETKGKLQEHTWVYRIKEDGTIRLLNESGDILPTWLNCE